MPEDTVYQIRSHICYNLFITSLNPSIQRIVIEMRKKCPSLVRKENDAIKNDVTSFHITSNEPPRGKTNNVVSEQV